MFKIDGLLWIRDLYFLKKYTVSEKCTPFKIAPPAEEISKGLSYGADMRKLVKEIKKYFGVLGLIYVKSPQLYEKIIFF